jgi:hypothetical protein
LWITVRDFPAAEDRRLVLGIPQGNRLSIPQGNRLGIFNLEIGSAPRSDQPYLWIYWISQRSKASYFGLLSAEPANVRASFILLRQL